MHTPIGFQQVWKSVDKESPKPTYHIATPDRTDKNNVLSPMHIRADPVSRCVRGESVGNVHFEKSFDQKTVCLWFWLRRLLL